jgi:hypothetical protein
MHDELGRVWNELVITSYMSFVDDRLEGLVKLMESPIQDSHCLS